MDEERCCGVLTWGMPCRFCGTPVTPDDDVRTPLQKWKDRVNDVAFYDRYYASERDPEQGRSY